MIGTTVFNISLSQKRSFSGKSSDQLRNLVITENNEVAQEANHEALLGNRRSLQPTPENNRHRRGGSSTMTVGISNFNIF